MGCPPHLFLLAWDQDFILDEKMGLSVGGRGRACSAWVGLEISLRTGSRGLALLAMVTSLFPPSL